MNESYDKFQLSQLCKLTCCDKTCFCFGIRWAILTNDPFWDKKKHDVHYHRQAGRPELQMKKISILTWLVAYVQNKFWRMLKKCSTKLSPKLFLIAVNILTFPNILTIFEPHCDAILGLAILLRRLHRTPCLPNRSVIVVRSKNWRRSGIERIHWKTHRLEGYLSLRWQAFVDWCWSWIP